MTESLEGKWEKRWHPLREEWVVYSGHRNSRPWSGSVENEGNPPPVFDKDCYLCPGNTRIHGSTNPDYKDVFIFDNDHPVVGPDAPAVAKSTGIYEAESASGLARVICYDPRHNVTLSEIPVAGVTAVVTEAMRGMPSFSRMLISKRSIVWLRKRWRSFRLT